MMIRISALRLFICLAGRNGDVGKRRRHFLRNGKRQSSSFSPTHPLTHSLTPGTHNINERTTVFRFLGLLQKGWRGQKPPVCLGATSLTSIFLSALAMSCYWRKSVSRLAESDHLAKVLSCERGREITADAVAACPQTAHASRAEIEGEGGIKEKLVPSVCAKKNNRSSSSSI